MSRLRPTLLDDQLIKLQFLRGPIQDSLFDRILCDEPKYIDLLGLTNSVRSVHGLQIGLGIPITVKQDDDVGCDEVDTETTGSGREQENKLFTLWRIVVVDGRNTGLVIGTTIDTAVFWPFRACNL